MKDINKDILSNINHRDGLTVPDGYFEKFADQMLASLPQRDEIERPSAVILPTPTLWTRIRPYVYLAAMFAGVWCMLKMFVLMSGQSNSNVGIDKNPILAEAISNDSFINDFLIDNIDQWDVIDDMIEDGFDASSISLDYDNTFVDPATH